MFAKFFLVLFSVFSLGVTPVQACAKTGSGESLLTPFTGAVKPYSQDAVKTVPTPGARAGIAPHHGLASEMIARFYNTLPDGAEHIVLIGPDHFNAGQNSITISPVSWRVGVRILETDAGALAVLTRTKVIGAESLPFRLEHSIGLHIDFIARRFPKAKVTALMVKNSATPRELSKLAAALTELTEKKEVLLILSMDFSHKKLPEEARHEDDKSIEQLLFFKKETLKGLDIDAPAAARLFLDVLESRGIKKGFVLERTNSSEIIGDPDMPCTSYATMIFR